MSAKSFVRKLMTRVLRTNSSAPIRKARPAPPLGRDAIGLEDRVVPAVLNYDAATDLLTFTADAGDTDNVTVTAPAANSVVIAVANGDTLTLTGDATLANGFVLNGALNSVTIDTATSPFANFNLNLGDANDTIAFSLASTPNGVQNVSIDGQANDDTATIGTTTLTGNLAVAAESLSSNGTATVGAGAGNSITLTADTITDANAAGVNFVAAAGTLTITKSNANATNVDLDTTVGSLNATAATGNIVIDETDGLTVTAANANGAGGSVTVTSATGNITVVTVNANTTATLTATAGAIVDDANNGTRIVAANASLTAGNGGIGAAGLDNEIDTTVATLTTNSSAANGSQFLNEADGLTELSLNAGAGNITLTVNGPILSADSAVDVTAADFSVTGNGPIGATSTAAGNAIETSVATLTLVSGGGGSVFIRETDAITLSLVAVLGPGNDLTLLNVTGDITVVSVGAADDVNLTATAGSILDDGNNATVIGGDVVALSAGANIGQPGATAQIDTTAASVTASATTAAVVATPGIWVGDTDAVTITSATTTDGTIVLDAGGTMTVGTVTADGTGRNVRLRTVGAGDIDFGAAGTVTAAGDGVRLDAVGAITESGTAVKVTAASLSASAVNGVGAPGDPLNTAVANLAGNSGGVGVSVTNTGALTIASVGPLFGVTVVGVASSGPVAVSAASPLTVAANVSSSSNITLTAADSAAAGDDLTVNAGVTVLTVGGSVTLNAGDNVSIPAGATVSAVTTITINADQAVDPDAGTGSTVTIAGDLNATGATINGGADADTFNITADGIGTITPITVNGGAPTTLPGDTLNYTGPSPATKSVTGPGAGTISAAGVGNVSYTSIETVASTGVIVFSDVIDLSLIAGGQDGNPNQIVLQLDATGAFFQVLVDTNTTDNGGVPNPVLFSQQPAANTLAVTVLGGTDADTLVLRANASGALPQLTGVATGSHSNAAFAGSIFVNSAGNKNVGLHYDGGSGAAIDALRVELGVAELVGYFSDTVDTANSGVVSIAGDLTLSFESLTPIVFVGAGGTLTVDATSTPGTTTLTITDVGTAQTDGVSQIAGDGGFETTTFSGFATLNVFGGDGAETITLTNVDGATPAIGAALTTVNIDADDSLGAADTDADTVTIGGAGISVPATVNVFVFGGAGLDQFNIGTPVGAGLLSPIRGNVSVDGEAGLADVRVDGSGAAVAANYEITGTSVERSVPAVPLFGGVDYTNAATLLLTVGAGPNVINVVSTSVPTTILTNAGADTINIGGDGVNGGLIPALAVPRSLDNILGTVTIDGGGVAGVDVDTVNINDQDDTGASTYGISATTITRTGAAAITYNVGGNTEVLNVNGSITAGSNTFNVTGTSATQSTTVNDGTAATSGPGVFNIQANAVQAGAAHTFNGFGGNDIFNVNFAADTSVSAAVGTTFVVNGGDPGVANPLNRDVVNISTVADTADRVLGFGFLGGGNATVTGLGTPTFLSLNTVESVIYASDVGGDDLATVTGTAASEVISVTPYSPSSAGVFLGGTPTIVPGAPADNDPGVAGGNAGPDLFLQNLQPGQAFGLTIVGGGGAADQLVVNAPTEAVNGAEQGAAWNAALFGGPAFATAVVPAGSAFDVINVTEEPGLAYVQINNGFLGGDLIDVNYIPASFAGTNAVDVVVNAGEEVLGAALVADDISVLLSTQIGYQINGGAPLPPGGAPLRGDRLNVVTPGDLNIYSDANDPPNVSITSSVNGTPTQPLTSNNIELTILTSGSGVVNILGDNNNTAVQNDAIVVLGQDVDSTLGGGDLFGDNEFQLLIGGDNTQSLTTRAPIAVRNALALNIFGFAGDDDIVLDPFANTTTPWNVVVNVDAGAGDDDVGYGNIITNVFADATPDGSQALVNEAVVVDVALSVGAGSITVPGVVTVSFQATEDLSFLLNATDLGDTDTLLVRTPDSPGVPETVTVRPDALGNDAEPVVDIDATTGAVQLLQIENVALVDQNNAQFFATSLFFELQNGGDTFDVVPSANGTAINVTGGAPAAPPGDILAINFAGTVNPMLNLTSGAPSFAGSWTFDNRAPINFSSFETMLPTVTVAATTQAAEPGTNGLFTFTRSGDTSLPLTVTYTVSGTATAGLDYTTLTGTVVIPAGSATATVDVAVLDDTIFEGAETVVVTVTRVNGDAYVLGTTPTATVTITDDDPIPTVALAADVTVNESEGAAVFTVTLTNPSTQTITVLFNTLPGTAAAGVDYTNVSTTLTFAPGQTSQTVSVPVTDDLLDEADELFTVTLSGPVNATLGTATATATIQDDDAVPTFTIDDVTVDEGAGTATFTVTLSVASGQTVTVDFTTADGTAVSTAVAPFPADYTTTAGTLTFAPGVTTQTITVPINDDTTDEPAQVFTVDLSAATNATIADASGSGTILDNDDAPTASVDDVTVDEAAGTATFTVTLGAASQHTVTLQATTADGTAVAGADYAAQTATLTFAPGVLTQTFTVTITDDLLDEADETYTVNLSDGVNVTVADGQGVGTITDNDDTPTLSVSGTPTVAEGGTAIFTVTLSAASGQPVTVTIATAPGTAAGDADYTTTTQTLTFAPGQTTQTVSVATTDDLLDEADETFTVTLSGATNATIDVGTDTATITDNDATPTVEIDDVTVDEGAGTATFTLTLSAASGQTITVDYDTANLIGTALAGEDFTDQAGSVTFDPGVLTRTVTISITDDAIDEPTQTFTLSLINGVNVGPGNKIDGVGTILDNDDAPTASVDDVTVDEAAGTATFTVTLSAASQHTVTVQATTADGTAVAGADYAAQTATLTFAPGVLTQTFTVTITDDLLDEADETYTVNLSDGVNVTVADGQGVGTITDNDDTPTLSVSGTPTVAEGGTAVFTVTLSAASGQPVTVTIATAPVTAEGGADYVTATQTLTFAPGETTQTFSVATTDDAIDEIDETFTVTLSGAVNATIDVATDTGTITDNDAPTAAADAYTVAEDVTLTVAAPGVLGNDTFANPASQAVLIADVANGTLTLNADGSFTYVPDANFNGTDSFTYQVDDLSGVNGLSNVVTVTITVTPVNDDPAVVVPGDQTVPEDTAQAIPGISVSDPDLTNPTNLQFHATVTLTVLNGTLTIGAANGVTAFGSGTRNVSLTGSMAAINALLAQATGVVYQGNLNYNGPDTLTVSVDDHGNLGQGVLIADATVAINVTAVNDAPTLAVPGPQTATEDVSLLIPGLTVADVDAGGDGVVVTLTVANGVLTALGTGVAGSGTAAVTISGPVAAVNAALATVRYVGNLHFSGADTLNVSVSDVGNTGAGGALTATGTVAITVVAVADAPTLTVTTPASGPEGSPIPLTIAATLVDTDGSESLSVVITGFPAGTTFSAGINDTTKVTLTPAQLAGLTMTLPDGAAAPGTTFTLQVTATATEASNGSAASTVRTITATVTNVAPTVTLTNNGPVAEGGTATVTATNQVDPSLPDVVAGLHYAFDFDNDGVFEVGNGTYAGSPASATATVPASLLDDGPGTRTVRVRVIDKDGGTSDSTTTITITNVAPTATFTGPTGAIERLPLTVTFSNPKDPSGADTLAGFTYTYDLNNDGVFEVGPTASPTATFTPATDGTYTVRGRIFDKDGAFTEYTANGSAGVVVRNVDRYAIGTGDGGAPRVIVYETGTDFVAGGRRLIDFFAYDAEFRGGVQVAVGDVTGDGVPDVVTGTGVGGGPHVKVFDGVTFAQVGNFLAYEESFRGGVQVAVGDVDGDGKAEIITGVGDTGGPVVKVFRQSGALVASFLAYEATFRGGVNVGAADLDGDGKAEILTGAGNGGGPVVKVFDGTTRALRSSFLAYEASFRGGVNVAGGDLDGDGVGEIVTGAGIGGGPVMKAFSPTGTLEQSVSAFGPDKIGGEPLRNGIRVAVHDIDGDGDHDAVAGSGPGYTASVSLRSGADLSELSFFLPYEADNSERLFTGGIYVG